MFPGIIILRHYYRSTYGCTSSSLGGSIDTAVHERLERCAVITAFAGMFAGMFAGDWNLILESSMRKRGAHLAAHPECTVTGTQAPCTEPATGVNDAAASGVSSSHAYTLHARLSYAWRAAAYVQRAALPCNFSEQSQLSD